MTQTESHTRITAAIHVYLGALEAPEKGGGDLGALARALDDLVFCYHATPDVDPGGEYGEVPGIDEAALATRVAAAYPMLGYYPVADPEGEIDQQVGLADGVSDLVEIAADLGRVLRLFGAGRENEAIWDFRFGYQTHWGRHLHEVRLYLHALAAW